MGNVWEELFGRRVKALRVARGWTQAQFAERMIHAGHPMHQTTIAKLESASRPTNVGEINAIASIFDVPMATLFDYSVKTNVELELAGVVNRLAAISAEKTRFEERLAALDAEYASVEAMQHELQQRIEEQEERELQQRTEEEDRAAEEAEEWRATEEAAEEVLGLRRGR